MGIISIPAYMYFGTNSGTRQVNMQIHADNNIISYFRGAYGNDYTGDIWNATGLNEKNIVTYLNNQLGSLIPNQNNINLFARNLEFYGRIESGITPSQKINKMSDLTGMQLIAVRNDYELTKIKTLNNFELTLTPGSYIGTVTAQEAFYYQSAFKGASFGGYTISFSATSDRLGARYIIYPEGIFTQTGININYSADLKPIELSISATCDTDGDTITSVRVTLDTRDQAFLDMLKTAYTKNGVEFTTVNSGINEEDSDNPYSNTPLNGSKIGGGDGDYNDPNAVDPADIPDLPSLSAADLGFITIYNPTQAQLKSLSNFMWSNLFDLDTYKKLFADPMDSIIGLSIVPVAPTVGGSKNVMFGSIDSGINMPYCSTQYVEKNCGSVDISKYIGSFLDASPYTKISLYLPFIGIQTLSADDIMGGSINVVYHIDVLSGACSAFVKHSSKGVLYVYNGSCISNIPLTSANYSGAIQNAVSAVCSGASLIAGMSTGAAPVSVMGAMGLLQSAANTALNSKPHIQRSGALGGSAGIMAILKPYVIIERPDISVPSNAPHMCGQTSNLGGYIGDFKGFTLIEFVHVEGISATSDELKEIESLLKGGVIL